MKLFWILPLLIILFPKPVAAAGNTYYVATNGSDANPGTLSQPLATLNAAVSKVGPGDTILVRGGTYNQPVSIQKKGTSSARITISNYQNESVTFNGNTFEIGTWNANNNSAFLDVSGFTITNANGYGLNHFGDDNRVSNMIINGAQKGGVNVVYSHRSDFDNLKVTNNVRSWGCNTSITGGWPSAVGVTQSSYISIKNSDVGNNCGEGMNAWDYTDHVTFANNIVHDNWSVEMYLDHSAYSTIENNLVYDTETTNPGNKNMPSGISISDESGRGWSTCTAHDNTIRNNIVVNTKYGISNFNYFSCAGLNNTKIENNTFVNQWEIGVRILGTNNTASAIRNNIIYPRSGATPIQITNSNGITVENNLSVDPKLVNINGCNTTSCPATNFKLTSSSPAIQSGNPNTSAIKDYFGTTRTTPVDIGAHEYSSGAAGPTPTPTPTVSKPGDANGDGKVDGIDYTVWLLHYGKTTSAGPSAGDFNRDNKVDGIDYTIWLTNYGK